MSAGTVFEFAPAKINLALHVLGRRADGYHELDSIVAFADVGDALKITPSTEFSIEASGPFANLLPPPRDNIIRAAWALARDIAAGRGRALPPARIELVKNLPVASGIGGGSADAAAALRAGLRLAGIAARDDEIRAAALTLGADVPVCLLGKPCRMQGVGERITAIEGFAPLHGVLVNPGVAVATKQVFARLALRPGESAGTPIAAAADLAMLRNDMTEAANAAVPEIADVLTALRQQPGISYARMSGSGATCFGIFDSVEAANVAARCLARATPRWWVQASKVQ